MAWCKVLVTTSENTWIIDPYLPFYEVKDFSFSSIAENGVRMTNVHAICVTASV